MRFLVPQVCPNLQIESMSRQGLWKVGSLSLSRIDEEYENLLSFTLPIPSAESGPWNNSQTDTFFWMPDIFQYQWQVGATQREAWASRNPRFSEILEINHTPLQEAQQIFWIQSSGIRNEKGHKELLDLGSSGSRWKSPSNGEFPMLNHIEERWVSTSMTQDSLRSICDLNYIEASTTNASRYGRRSSALGHGRKSNDASRNQILCHRQGQIKDEKTGGFQRMKKKRCESRWEDSYD